MWSLVFCDLSGRWMDEIGNVPCQGGSGKNCKNGDVRTDHFLEPRLIEGWGYRIAGLSRKPLPGIISGNRISAPVSIFFDCAALAGFLLGIVLSPVLVPIG
jgi:hypothetical protein